MCFVSGMRNKTYVNYSRFCLECYVTQRNKHPFTFTRICQPESLYNVQGVNIHMSNITGMSVINSIIMFVSHSLYDITLFIQTCLLFIAIAINLFHVENIHLSIVYDVKLRSGSASHLTHDTPRVLSYNKF